MISKKMISEALGFSGASSYIVESVIGGPDRYTISVVWGSAKINVLLDYDAQYGMVTLWQCTYDGQVRDKMVFEQVEKTEDLVYVFKTYFAKHGSNVVDLYAGIKEYCRAAGIDFVETSTVFEARSMKKTPDRGYHVIINKADGSFTYDMYVMCYGQIHTLKPPIHDGESMSSLNEFIQLIWEIESWQFCVSKEAFA